MWLSQLHIHNFRKIEDLLINFPHGLSVIVGENNIGKTTIIDALRLILFPIHDFNNIHLSEDDFTRGEEIVPIELSCLFTDLSSNDEVNFMECLVDIGDGKFNMILNARAEFNHTSQRVNIKYWGGETESGTISQNIYDKVYTIYLPPLRDPEAGLKAGRYSQVARLIDSITKETDHKEFEDIAKEANNLIHELNPIKEAKRKIDFQMLSIAGPELTQSTELIFSDPTFKRIISGLQPEINNLPFGLNGLGYNNLVFTAATLSTLKIVESFSYRSLLIEEPEAHLHPQLQQLLLRHLNNLSSEKDSKDVQVFTSSHSPIFASQAPIDSLIVIHKNDGDCLSAFSVFMSSFDPLEKAKLQRFLDSTRSELFFARRLLLVEGISEALLLPIFANILSKDLKNSSVTIVNVNGINFNCFIPLFGKDKINIPIIILTDGDDKERTGTPSSKTLKLLENTKNIPNLRVLYCSNTFEHELARSQYFLPSMVHAFTNIHPELGRELSFQLDKISSADDKADLFLQEFLRSETSKGAFAQELANLIEGKEFSQEAVPSYIRTSFDFLGII